MTPMEAIKRLKNIIAWNGERDDYIAVDVGVKALEKQIPKKPMLTFKSNEYLTVHSHCCPVCKSSIIEGQKFCDECGHKLDWGSVNDTIFM